MREGIAGEESSKCEGPGGGEESKWHSQVMDWISLRLEHNTRKWGEAKGKACQVDRGQSIEGFIGPRKIWECIPRTKWEHFKQWEVKTQSSLLT